MRVYCGNCRHYKEEGDGFDWYEEGCRLHRHKKRSYKHEWVVLGDPSVINKNNDCKGFDQKIGVFKRIFG